MLLDFLPSFIIKKLNIKTKSSRKKESLEGILSELYNTRSEIKKIKKDMFKEIQKCIINIKSELIEPIMYERKKLLNQISQERVAHKKELLNLINSREEK